MIEAGATRKMVFASEIPPFEELIEAGISGILFGLDEDPKAVAHRIFKEFILEAPGANITNAIKNITYRTYKKLYMEVVDPDFEDAAKSIIFQIYKKFVMDIVDSNFSYVMEKFSWDTILSKKMVPLL